jgi:hypothetical protein
MTIVAIDVRFRNSHCGCRASEPPLVDPMIKWWSLHVRFGSQAENGRVTNVCPPIADIPQRGVSQVTLV